jgi:hypothetical protein
MLRIIKPHIFSNTPALTICGIFIKPEAKTIAFGAVATGNMNAQLAAKVMGIQSSNGETPNSSATAATTGKNVAVVARLLVSSVKKITSAVAAITRAKIPNASK